MDPSKRKLCVSLAISIGVNIAFAIMFLLVVGGRVGVILATGLGVGVGGTGAVLAIMAAYGLLTPSHPSKS